MSAVRQVSPTVQEYVAVFDDEISSNLSWGRSGDWNKLRRRLDVLDARLRDAAAASTLAPARAYRLEHSLWVEMLREALLPTVRADLVRTLRSQRRSGEADPGVWASLDRKSFDHERKRHRRKVAFADAAVITALKRHAENPSHLRMLEGLRALEDLYGTRLALAPTFGEEQLVTEGKHLAEALRTLLPSTARRLLSSEVEGLFRSEVEGKPIGQLKSPAPFWHHKIPGVGVWQPVWMEVLFGSEAADPLGVWFIERFQAIYERRHAQAEAERTGRREEKEEERRAAKAAEERQMGQEEEGRRAREARLREEEARRQQEERERQAALEEARKPALREDAERQADMEAQREAERAERKEQARRTRALAPPQSDYWKRRPEEIQARWGEAEWRRWCKSKGLSPDEVPYDVRERFMRHI